MIRRQRPAIRVASDDMASRLLPLDERIVVGCAQALVIVGIDEQGPITFVRGAMIDDGGRRGLTLGQTTLAQRLPRQLLLPQPVTATPHRQIIELAVRRSLTTLRITIAPRLDPDHQPPHDNNPNKTPPKRGCKTLI